MSVRQIAAVLPLLAALSVPVVASAREEVPEADFASVEEARAALERAYAEAAAVTPLPATLAAERAYYDALFASATAEEVLYTYDGYIEDLWRVTNHASAMPDSVTLDTFDSVCIGEVLSNCSVTAAGWINGGEDFRIAWQTQDGFTPEDGIRGGIVLLEPDGDQWRVLAWDFAGYRYDAPHVSQDGFLSVPGFMGGTGGGRADLLFARDENAWTQIELVTWQNQLPDFLPAGLAIWQGVFYNFDDPRDGLSATSPLWRETDGNCCGTGGNVRLIFERQGTGLVIAEAEVEAAE